MAKRSKANLLEIIQTYGDIKGLGQSWQKLNYFLQIKKKEAIVALFNSHSYSASSGFVPFCWVITSKLKI